MKDRSSLEAVYEGLDAAEAACRPEWAALLAAARPHTAKRVLGELRARNAEREETSEPRAPS